MKNDRKLAREPMADACPQPLSWVCRKVSATGCPCGGGLRQEFARIDDRGRIRETGWTSAQVREPVPRNAGTASSLPTGQRTWPLRVPHVLGVSVSRQDDVATVSSVIVKHAFGETQQPSTRQTLPLALQP